MYVRMYVCTYLQIQRWKNEKMTVGSPQIESCWVFYVLRNDLVEQVMTYNYIKGRFCMGLVLNFLILIAATEANCYSMCS